MGLIICHFYKSGIIANQIEPVIIRLLKETFSKYLRLYPIDLV